MYDKEKIKWVFEQVHKRLKAGNKEYEDTHVLSDLFGKDIKEQLLDELGYRVVAIVRAMQDIKKFKPKIDRVHFQKFIPEQDTPFLLMLKKYVDKELEKRK